MSEDIGDMTGGGQQGNKSAAVPAGSPLEDDNLLSVILCRLPSVPSSLPRASLVCKPWRLLVSDPRFHRDFRSHHQKPPLLGFFSIDFFGNIEFTTMLDPSSDCIPAERFSLRVSQASRVLRSHHGRVLVLNQQGQQHFLVWDPVTGELLKRMLVIDGGVVCAATDQGHVHGACHSDPFRVVFIGEYKGHIFACVYSSETRAWGNLFTMTSPLPYCVTNSPKCPSTLVRNSICMLIFGERAVILEFDWGRGTLAHLDVPSDAYHFDAFIGGMCQFMVTPADAVVVSASSFYHPLASMYGRGYPMVALKLHGCLGTPLN